MFHLNTELLIDYWRERRGERALPRRSQIDPADFVQLLPSVFIAVRAEGGGYRFRLVGEAVSEAHGHALVGQDLAALWRLEHRRRLGAVLDGALRDAVPAVIAAEARTDEADMSRYEILFAPLAGTDDRADRLIGLYQSVSSRGRGRLRELAITAVNGVRGETLEPHLRLAAVDGRQIA
jgi:hypothetical protein